MHHHPAPAAGAVGRRLGRNARRPLAVLAAGMLAMALAVTGCSGSGSESASPAGDQRANHAPGDGEAGVGDSADQAPDSTTDGEPGQSDSKPGEQSGTADQKPPKITPDQVVRKARLTVRVKDVTSALDDTRTAVESAGGYVGDETTDRDSKGHERSHLVLRVPQEEYSEVLDELADSGKLIERKVTADDVTDRMVDVKSRIASQKSSVERVRKLMDDATELSDVVSLESELSTRQSALESLQAQQASLKDRTALATITLVLSETEVKKKEKKDDETGFTDALDGGWQAFVTTMRWIAVVIGATLPFLAALALLLVGWRLVRGRVPRRERGAWRPASVPAGAGGGRPPAPAGAPSTVPPPAKAPEAAPGAAGAAGDAEPREAAKAPEAPKTSESD